MPILATDQERLQRQQQQALVTAAPTGSWRRSLLLVLVALLASVPFVRKPLHIDDPADLQYVRQILNEPLDPYGFEFDWGEGPRPAIRNYHPPLKFYYHAAVLAVVFRGQDPFRSDWLEEVLHLSYLPFVWLIVVSVYRLCGHFEVPAWSVLLFWLFGPGFLPGQNAMLDVPALALGLTAAALLSGYWADRRLRRALAAGVVLAAGLLTKYSVAIVWIVAAYWLWLERAEWRAVLAVLLPGVAAVALWAVVSQLAYGTAHPLMVLRGVPGQVGAQSPGLNNLIDSVVFLGGAVPAVVVLLALRGGRLTLVLLGAIPAALGLFTVRRPELNIVGNVRDLARENLVWWFVLAVAGAALVFVVGVTVLRAWRNGAITRRRLVLAVWFAVSLVLGSAAAPFVAMRRVLDTALVGSMLVFAEVPVAGNGLARRWVELFVVPVTLLLNAFLGYTAAISDYELAAVYPKYAAIMARDQRKFTNKAWCYGYWGWMFYAERNGLKRYVPGREEPADGDMFVWLDVVAKPAVIPDSLRSRLRDLFKEYQWGNAPLRMMSKQAGAGYYSNVWGPLPYAWSQVPVETLKAAVVEGPPPQQRNDRSDEEASR